MISVPSNVLSASQLFTWRRLARDGRLSNDEMTGAQADRSSHEALIVHLKLEIEKLRRELYGSSSERKARLLSTASHGMPRLETAAD
jgi:transposase-like protein